MPPYYPITPYFLYDDFEDFKIPLSLSTNSHKWNVTLQNSALANIQNDGFLQIFIGSTLTDDIAIVTTTEDFKNKQAEFQIFFRLTSGSTVVTANLNIEITDGTNTVLADSFSVTNGVSTNNSYYYRFSFTASSVSVDRIALDRTLTKTTFTPDISALSKFQIQIRAFKSGVTLHPAYVNSAIYFFANSLL